MLGKRERIIHYKKLLDYHILLTRNTIKEISFRIIEGLLLGNETMKGDSGKK